MLLACAYSQFERVRKEIESFSGVAEDISYGADVLITALIPAEAEANFQGRIVDISAGTVIPEIVGEEYRAVPAGEERYT
jgi:putative IMPACT (imprinted ancient) family translation regulator